MKRRTFVQSTALASSGLWMSPWRWVQNSLSAVESEPLPFRQVHLDFHTSKHISKVANEFDARQFVATCKGASVNSVTVFGRCHHGYIYHDTKLFPERHHPGLNRNLLKEQVDALHSAGIAAPIYVTIQWDHFTAQRHPEWLCVDDSGQPFTLFPAGKTAPQLGNNYQAGFYRYQDVWSPYGDFLKDYLKELFEVIEDVDGLFLDILHPVENNSPSGIRRMQAAGINPEDPTARRRFAFQSIEQFKIEFSAFIKGLDQSTRIFYNSAHIMPLHRSALNANTHLELESLPSGPSGTWGYLHFPATARYARTLDKEILGMTGKFHTLWGDFHSLKNRAALEFEVFQMLALNAKCSIGDQLHPNGILDKATYDLIGKVYAEVAQKEAYCIEAIAKTDIGVLNPEEMLVGQRGPGELKGIVRILQEGKHQFDIIDRKSYLDDYKVLILPDVISIDRGFGQKLRQFIKNGGSVLATYHSGLKPDKSDFALAEFGLKYVEEAPYSPDYIVIEEGGLLAANLPETQLVMYKRGAKVSLTEAKSLLTVNEPYFNRTWQHFMSHQHTPSSNTAGAYPAAAQNGNVIYFMHPLSKIYDYAAPKWIKTLVLNALDILLPSPLVKTENAPSTLIATFNSQAAKNRDVLHLLHYIPEKRSIIETIEDIIPLYNIRVSIKTKFNPKQVSYAISGKKIPFSYRNERTDLVIPKIEGHEIIVFER